MNFFKMIPWKAIILYLFCFYHLSFAIGTDNTPGRPVPIQAPGGLDRPFISIPSSDPRAEIVTKTPEELAAPEEIQNRKMKPVSVILMPAKGSHAAGSILFFQDGNTMTIKGYLAGLDPGKHGLHIHTNEDCSDRANNFESAGPHFNPMESHHGSLQKGHLGDLGNITADSRGIALFTIKTNKITLEEGRTNSIMGRSIMVHKKQDDEKTDPAGKSGERILCGVIE